MAVGTGWEPFFVATSGASAALAGLVFVAMSINLDHIIETRGLHLSGLDAIARLLLPLVLSISVLAPTEGAAIYVAEAVAGGAAVVAVAVIALQPIPPHRFSRRVIVTRLASTAITVAPLAAAAITAGTVATSLGWLAAGVIVSILGGCFGAWAMLVFIERDRPARSGSAR